MRNYEKLRCDIDLLNYMNKFTWFEGLATHNEQE
jgi:hypothetical protein